MMAPFLLLKQFLRALSPTVLWVFSFLFLFLLAAESRPLPLVHDTPPVLESLRGINALDALRPIRSNLQSSFRALYICSMMDEDFDGDDEDITSACLEVCYLLVPTEQCEIFVPEIRVGQARRGMVHLLFERPPPRLIREFVVPY